MAIAFDSATSNTTANSWSHTCTGSNLILIVCFRSTVSSTTCTYNSVSMTKISSVFFNSSADYLNTFYLFNPSTGSNTVQCGNAVSNDGGVSVSYTGVGGFDVTNAGVPNTTTSSYTGSLTTSNDNSRVILCTGTRSATQSASTGCVQRAVGAGAGQYIGLYDNNANKTPPGSVSETVTFSSSLSCGFQMFSLQPELGVRYWVGGTGTWDSSSTTHWSQTSGGTSGATPPSTQATYIDGSSGGGTVTLGANATTGNFTTSGFTGTFAQSTYTLSSTDITMGACTWSGSGADSISGNLTLNASMTLSYTGAITFTSTSSGKTITTAGKTISSAITFNGVGGAWTLQDALTSSTSITITNGSIDLNDFNNSVTTLSNAGTIIMGTGTLSLTGTGTVWTCTGIITKETSTINLTNSSSSSKTFAGGGLTYYNLTITSGSTGTYTLSGDNTFNNFYLTGSGTGALTISGSNTYADFKIDTPPHTVNFGAGETQSFQTFTVSGTAGNLITLQSTSSGSKWYLVKTTTGNVVCDYLSLQDSHASSV